MTIPSRPAVGALALATILLATVDARQQRETRERTIDVAVVDRGGAVVAGLTAKDFVVRENGLAREVLKVAAAPPPSHVAVLVDDSQATQNVTNFLRPAVTGFVETLGRAEPKPQLALWTFGERPTRRVVFTPDGAQLAKAILQVFPVNNSGAYFMEAVGEAIRDLKARETRHPAIVAFVAESGPEFSNVFETQLAASLRESGASLWAIALQISGQPMGTTALRERARVLGDTTMRSGGATDVILTAQALESSFAQIAAQLTSRYEVTYGRPESMIPPEKVEVEVKRSDVQVRASHWAGR